MMAFFREQRMKAKIFLSMCVLMFSTLTQGASITLSTGAEGAIVLETDSVGVESGTAGTAVFSCDDVRWLSDTGEPRIPWKVIAVLLPPNTELSSVTCRVERPVLESITGTWQVEPMPPRATWGEDGQVIVVWPEDKRIVDGRDTGIYERDAFWPQEQVRLLGTGQLRKWRLAEIAVPLVRYNPVTGKLLKFISADITVTYRRHMRPLATPITSLWGKSRVEKMAVNFREASQEYGIIDTAADISSMQEAKETGQSGLQSRISPLTNMSS